MTTPLLIPYEPDGMILCACTVHLINSLLFHNLSSIIAGIRYGTAATATPITATYDFTGM
jgi:hypothetical protein